MIAERARAIVDAILKREGAAFTNLPADRGGPTKYGVTLALLEEDRGHALEAADVAALTEGEARELYERRFILGPHFDAIADPYLQELLVDAAVNHGATHPVKWVQWAAEVRQDGVLGPVSLAAINACAPLELFLWVLAFRIRLYGRLVSQDPQLRLVPVSVHVQAIFGAGWNNRAAEFLEAAARRVEADWAAAHPR